MASKLDAIVRDITIDEMRFVTTSFDRPAVSFPSAIAVARMRICGHWCVVRFTGGAAASTWMCRRSEQRSMSRCRARLLGT